MKLNSNTSPNGKNKIETWRLDGIVNRLNAFSALAGVLHDALGKVAMDSEDAETAHIEMVLMRMNYDLAATAEELEKIVAAVKEDLA
jgi:hypothetical protein